MAAAPPLREASAGDGRGPGDGPTLIGMKTHTLCRWHNGSCGQDVFFSAHLFSLHSIRSGFHRAKGKKTKKILLAAIQASPSPVNTLLPKPVCRGDCRAVFTHL